MGRRGLDSSGSDRDKWRTLVDTVMIFRFVKNAGNFYTQNLPAFQKGLPSMALVS